MKKILLPAIILSTVLTSAFTIVLNWKADKEKSTVTWEIPNTDKKGIFTNLVSTIDFDTKKLDKAKITASIEVKTLKAGNEKLETHLLSPDFFDAAKFPNITFTSTEIKSADVGYIAKGTLHMKDSTKVVEIPFTFAENGKDAATFSGTISVNCAEYGVMKADKAGKDKVMVYLVVPVTK